MKFVNNNECVLLNELVGLLDQADGVCMAVAYVCANGLNLLAPHLRRMIGRGGSVRLLFSTDFGITDADAISTLQSMGAELKHYSGGKTFHAKAYIVRVGEIHSAVVGPSNISTSALVTGVEWSLSVTNTDHNVQQLQDEFLRIWHSSSAKPVTAETLAALREQQHSAFRKQFLAAEAPEPVQDDAARAPQPSGAHGTNTPLAKRRLTVDELLADPRNYRRKGTWSRTLWASDVASQKLQSSAQRYPDACFLVRCWPVPAGGNGRLYAIPYSVLLNDWLPHAYLEPISKLYKFEVHTDGTFNWRHQVHRDGGPYYVGVYVPTQETW